MVKEPKEYRWSSYNWYAYGIEDHLISQQPVYQSFGRDAEERQQKYRQFVKGMLKEKNAMKGEMDRKLVYGSSAFIGTLTKKYLIAGELRAIGRPKKTSRKIKDNRPLLAPWFHAAFGQLFF